MPLWVATLAVRQKSRMVLFNSGAEMLREFGLPPDGPHYRRVVEGFKRIFGSTIYFWTDEAGSHNAVWDCRRFHFFDFFDRLKVWCRRDRDPDAEAVDAENMVVLSEPFWQEIQGHPIPVDLAAARSLAHIPGCLDLFMWLTWRCYNAKRTETVPLFEATGLIAQLGVVEYSRARNFRKRVGAWLKIVEAYWPNCPARLSDDADSVTVAPSTAILGRAVGLFA